MKSINLLAVSALFLSIPAFGQKAGDAVTTEALGKDEWIKGAAPAEWEPGKVYIFECWATWCGPCIAAIPHVDALYDKYKDQGLRVFGMDVFEDGKEKPAAFVKKKGDGMSYPVAYVGKGGAFETEWLIPAGVNAIPYAFVVKEGKVLFGTHPGSLSEPMIEALLAGGEAQKAEVDKILLAQNSGDEVNALMGEFSRSIEAKDGKAAKDALAKIRAVDENNLMLGYLEVCVAALEGDWETANKVIKESKSTSEANGLVMLAEMQQIEVPKNVLETVVDSLTPGDGEEMDNPVDSAALASVLWKLGKKDEATAVAEKTAKGFQKLSKEDGVKEATEAYVESFKQGKPQGVEEFFASWSAAATPK